MTLEPPTNLNFISRRPPLVSQWLFVAGEQVGRVRSLFD